MAYFIEIQSFPCLCSSMIRFHSDFADVILSLRQQAKLGAKKFKEITNKWTIPYCFSNMHFRLCKGWQKTRRLGIIATKKKQSLFSSTNKKLWYRRNTAALENSICLFHNVWCMMSEEIYGAICHISGDRFNELTHIQKKDYNTF